MIRETPALYAALVGRAARAISQRLSAVDATMVGRGRALGFGGQHVRVEHDLLGEREVPDEALYGIQTLRALENFPITGVPLREFPSLIDALAAVKEAAALRERRARPAAAESRTLIVRAAREIRAGRHHEHFLVDMIQGGAGTSTNMNANEVIANRALELLGRPRGDYQSVHPNNHVNLSQSTNDVYPTAMKLALHAQIEGLARAMSELAAAFLAKGDEFSPFIKMGRTQLQDAVPMTLGQEFTAFGHTILEDVRPARRGAGADPRDQHGRDRDRHRHQRAGGLRGSGARAPLAHHGARAHHRARPRRGHRRHRRVRAVVRVCSSAAR